MKNFKIDGRINTAEMIRGEESWGNALWHSVHECPFEADTEQEALELARDYLMENLSSGLVGEYAEDVFGIDIYDEATEEFIEQIELRVVE